MKNYLQTMGDRDLYFIMVIDGDRWDGSYGFDVEREINSHW